MKLLQANTIPKNARLIVGVSGGKDSMSLIHALKNERPDLTLFPVHIDHKLRKDSTKDAAFVKKTLKSWGLPCLVHTLKEAPQGNMEEWARKQRYSVFETRLHKEAADFIVTAHHQADDLESFFLHLLRGTRVKGLSGMESQRGKHLRPLLHTPVKNIQNYIKEHGIPFKEDPSNQDQSLKRNWLRHTLLPQIEQSHPGFTKRWQSQKPYWLALQGWMESEASQFLTDNLNPIKGLKRKTYKEQSLPLRYSILEIWLQKSTGQRVADQKSLDRWDKALCQWPSGKKTEWGKGFFLVLARNHAKVEPIV